MYFINDYMSWRKFVTNAGEINNNRMNKLTRNCMNSKHKNIFKKHSIMLIFIYLHNLNYVGWFLIECHL